MEVFEDVYKTVGPRLIGELYAITGSFAEAEDAVQEAFVRAYARWRQVGAMDAPAAWVRRVALNLATSRWRARRRAAALAHRLDPLGSTVLHLPDDTSHLIDALRTLPSRQRVAIVLHYWSDLSVVDVAEAMRLPVPTVKSHLRRGRAALATHLGVDLADAAIHSEPAHVRPFTNADPRRGVSRD